MSLQSHRDLQPRQGEPAPDLSGLLGTIRGYEGPMEDYRGLFGLIGAPRLPQVGMDLQSTQNNGPYTLHFGITAVVLVTLESRLGTLDQEV